MNRGDYSRITHKRFKHYTGVLKQQGRVELDADWLEDHEIVAYLRQILTQDIIGSCGFPNTGGGFETSIFLREFPPRAADNAIRWEYDLGITPGRGYVDGILCELEETTPVPITRILPDETGELRRVQVSTLVVDDREFQEGQLVDFLPHPAPHSQRLARITGVERIQRTLTLDRDMSQILGVPPEFEYAFGLELRRVNAFTSQPDSFNAPLWSGTLAPGDSFLWEGQVDLIYLDVWQRHITAVEDPDILEVALGGADTTTRVKTVWQVKVQRNVKAPDGQDPIASDGQAATECGKPIEGWPPTPSGGRLTTEVVPTSVAEDRSCLIAPSGGYRGLENRLYRVEIHQGGGLGEATFKWSRDNGSVVFPIEEFVSARQVKVKRIGRDQVLRLHRDDWLEILDDGIENRQDHTAEGDTAGTMARIDDINEEDRILILDRDVPADNYSVTRHARIRRWDQRHDVDGNGLLTTTTDLVPLEEGIQVKFSGEGFKAGDYWVFAARTTTGDVERLTDEPPQGIKHHYCRLALIFWFGELEFVDGNLRDTRDRRSLDCRPTFMSLTEITRLMPESSDLNGGNG
jgi:hypothetical protein